MKERLDTVSLMESCMSNGGSSGASSDPQFSQWADTRLDRWLVDWALRSGKDKTAKRIARDKGIEVSFTIAVTVIIDVNFEIRHS